MASGRALSMACAVRVVARAIVGRAPLRYPWGRTSRTGGRMAVGRPKRKNPVLRTRQATLPPAGRSRVALGMLRGPARGMP